MKKWSVSAVLVSAVLVISGCSLPRLPVPKVFITPPAPRIDVNVPSQETPQNPTAPPMAAGYLNPMFINQIVTAALSYAFSSGGYWIGLKPYRPGEWTRWEIKSDGEVTKLEKASLKKLDDGKEWWRISISQKEEEEITFEILFSPDLAQVLRIRAKFPGQEPGEVPVAKGTFAYVKPVELTEESLKGAKVGEERIKSPAGDFTASHVVYRVIGGGTYEWWTTEKVPGGVVRYLLREKDAAKPIYDALLVGFGKGATTKLGSY